MRNKKGALELGINAIVVLIIALAILGLAIGFITKLMGQSQTKFEGLLDQSELPVHATSDKPLVFDPLTIKVRARKTAEMTVVVYNSCMGPAEYILSMPNCVDDNGQTTYGLTIAAAVQTVNSGVEGGFKALIKADPANSPAPGTYICTIEAAYAGDSCSDKYSQQLFVNVLS